MNRLWYGSDEVTEFHPVVEDCLNRALINARLNEKYEIRHHYGLFTMGIPDFSVLDKVTNDFVCIIEVKKAPSDVFYRGSSLQARGYVEELFPLRWKTNYYPYFCVTNIEFTQFFSHRVNSPLIGCLLTGSPHDSGMLQRQEECISNFVLLFSNFFRKIDQRVKPEFSRHLEAISESFNESFYEVAEIIGVNFKRINKLISAEEEIKQCVLYELLRFAFYYYIKENYLMRNHKFSEYFRDFNVKGLSHSKLVDLILSNFSKAMQIDFIDIFKNYDSPNAIIPKRLVQEGNLNTIFNVFIQTLQDNAPQGIQKKANIRHYVSLLTDELYDREEMHSTGKIMSDEVLSNILAEFTVTSHSNRVIDPCCGDGNLLIAAYNKLIELNRKSNKLFEHNNILEQLNGIEIDPNLAHMGAFKLICQRLDEVSIDTNVNILHADLFETNEVKKYDSLVMNPPFLRNEDVPQEMKVKYLKNIEDVTGQTSFIREVRQPNKYFYFVEKAISMLCEDGKGSIILMTKFLNNKDGVYLKEYLRPYLKAIISYPPEYFEEFRVTTCIILISKNKNIKNNVSFLRIINTGILSNLQKVEEILENKKNQSNDNYSLVIVNKKNLAPEQNWRVFLVDPEGKFEKLESLVLLKPLGNFFKVIKRGKSDNNGGSSIIYPFSTGNPLFEDAQDIEPDFIGCGLQRNKIEGGRRKFILTKDCVNSQQGLIVPDRYDTNSENGLSNTYSKYPGLNNYYQKARKAVIKKRLIIWEKIVNNCFGSRVRPKIILPRADRTKHTIYYNPLRDEDILISTNFFYLDELQNYNQGVEQEIQIEFITAWLLSSFGQLQFEVHGNNQEGMRKIEKFIIERIRIPDLRSISKQEFEEVVNKFRELNDLDEDVSGLEGTDDLRRNLDVAIGKILFERNRLGFNSINSLVDYFENFLKEVVEDRVNE